MDTTKINQYVVTIKTENVNSKRIKKVIDEYILTRLQRLPMVGPTVSAHVMWNIQKVMSEFINSLSDEGRIERYQVICDQRNNGKRFRDNGGFFAITIKYRQTHCLNETQLKYEMKHDTNKTH